MSPGLGVLTTDDQRVVSVRVALHRVQRLLTDAGDVHVTPVVHHLRRHAAVVDDGARRLTQVVQ